MHPRRGHFCETTGWWGWCHELPEGLRGTTNQSAETGSYCISSHAVQAISGATAPSRGTTTYNPFTHYLSTITNAPMNLQPGQLYHIYNRGNNRQRIFFSHENYLYFLTKLRKYLTPQLRIYAWCLMPNHFHLLVEVREQATPATCGAAFRTLLSSYTRAI